MSCALSLHAKGMRDFVLVDSAPTFPDSARASVMHAATLEALDTVSLADKLVSLGNPSPHMTTGNASGPLLVADFSQLASQTRFPFALVLPQNVAERVMAEKLNELGVPIVRPKMVVDLRPAEGTNGQVDVQFESGEHVLARYVVGADGARSTVRKCASIPFTSPPDSHANRKDMFSSEIIADVVISGIGPSAGNPRPTLASTVHPTNFVSSMVLPSSYIAPGTSNPVSFDPRTESLWRVICGTPTPPSKASTPIDEKILRAASEPHPSISDLQLLTDTYAPAFLRSSSTGCPQITRILWASRFSPRSAQAECVFRRLPSDLDGRAHGGAVLLIGDACHVHPPVGGQGLNLGVRDAIALGVALSNHIFTGEISDEGLHTWAAERQARATKTIQTTGKALAMIAMDLSVLLPFRIVGVKIPGVVEAWLANFKFVGRDFVLWTLGRFAPVRKARALQFSGLLNR